MSIQTSYLRPCHQQQHQPGFVVRSAASCEQWAKDTQALVGLLGMEAMQEPSTLEVISVALLHQFALCTLIVENP